MIPLWSRRRQHTAKSAGRPLRVRLALEKLEERCLLSASAYVRVNQVGYVDSGPKQALLMASIPETGARFSVLNSSGQVVYSAAIGARQPGTWNSNFPYVYALDFSAVGTDGTYSLTVKGPVTAHSLSFAIGTGANLYSGLLKNAVFFYQAQQDGSNVNSSVMGRQPSHLTDSSASVYQTPTYNSNDVLTSNLVKVGGPVDVSGGWFDAGDYLKFVETASYTTDIMLLAARNYPTLLGSGGVADVASQAKSGLEWLLKMWNDSTQTLYYQVGIGSGNANGTS
jgi:endoglucanase